MSLFGIRTGITARGRRGLQRAWLLGATMTLALVLAGCGDVIPSTNTYPIDFFSEMHYQQSFGAGEPDGGDPPDGAVPITGGEVDYSFEEAAELENPFDSNPELGQEVYELNCVQCHGAEGAGDGYAAGFFEGYGATVPANLQESDLNEGEMFHVVTNGLGEYMPGFQPLITEEERWALVEYLQTEIQ
ncbi:MAG: c-type cytochrome [Thermomicrobiaceae bacterium]